MGPTHIKTATSIALTLAPEISQGIQTATDY